MTIIWDEINHNLLKTISEIAKKENTTEIKVLEDMIEKGIASREYNQPIVEKIKN